MFIKAYFYRIAGLIAIVGLPNFSVPVVGQAAVVEDKLFLFSNPAYTLPARRGAFALLHTARYGVSNRVELGFHPVAMFLSPDIEVKWKQIETDRYTWSSFHSVNYPSPLMRTVQISGAGGFISPEFIIPDVFAFQNGVLISTTLHDRHFLTGRALLEFAVNTKTLDDRTTVDLPILFPRSVVYYKGYGFVAGATAEGKLIGRFSYLVSTDVFLFPRGGLDVFSENKLCTVWRTGKKFMLLAGGVLTYGDYPFGRQWHLLPVMDFRWFLRV